MFSSSQFVDSNSTFSGAGFMSSQLPDSTPSPAKSRDSGGVVPVTVKQINEASPASNEKSTFVIDGVDVTNVTLVGMVFDKAEKVTDVDFLLDDGTGHIKCKRWMTEFFDTKEMGAIQDGVYVRLNGHLKSHQGVTELALFSARLVTNFDEIAFHFIDCIHFHLQNSKLQLGGAATQSQKVDSSLNTPVVNGSNGYQMSPSKQFSMQFSVDGLKDREQLVLEYLQQSLNSQEKGTHRDEISQHLKLPTEKIMESIRYLEDEGLIYSTIDEFHFKAA